MWIEKDRIKPKNNFVVTQAWASKDSQKLPTKYGSFQIILTYLKLYCQYSTLTSFKYLADSQRTWFERIVWIIIHCITISSLVSMVYISYKEFTMTPMLTSMDSDNYRTTDLDFPAIAICSINRISRQSAMELATNIFEANITDLSFDEIVTLIAQLGNLYSSVFNMDESRNVEIDQLLKTYYNGAFDITEIMKNLSPNCSMLLKCELHGTFRNCSQLFEFRKTQDGFCCTFNYVRERDDIPVIDDLVLKPIEPHKVFDLGIERGLTVVMEPFLEDYFFSLLPVVGWKIIVFNPTDFPDTCSGGVTEVIAMPRSETYVDVTTTAFFSTDIIKSFPVQKRNCVFPEEIHTAEMYSGTMYTYSDCIVDCKLYDIEKSCGCRPFFYPRRGKKNYASRICTNSDVKCLASYKSKWWTVFPHESDEEMIYNEEWALHCNGCYPTCDDVNYDVLSSKSYISVGEYKTNLLWNFNITDQGILHVFFSKYGTIRLKQDVASHWYELLSDIGGLCGVFIGFSFISVVELLYFLALLLRNLLCKKSALQEDDDDNHEENEIRSIQKQTAQMIYWNELLPRSWQSVKYGQFPNNRIRY